MLKHKFSTEQEKAIKHWQGPMMVLAGPGSGKTFVVTQRIYHLIKSLGISPNEILVITFTKAAALEMQKRFQKLIGSSETTVHFGTFHAVFFTILKETGYYHADSIMTQADKRTYLQECLQLYASQKEVYETEYLDLVLSEISKMKNTENTEKYLEKICCMEPDDFYKIYKQYLSVTKEHKKLDFDDIMLKCLELLQTRQSICKKYQKQFPYILIDEFQDISPIQYKIIKLLAMPAYNLFIVGDDDQSIYEFRGADPSIMLHFENDFENVKKVILQTNYRCTGNIVEAAQLVISENKLRFSKELCASKEAGMPILIEKHVSKELQYQKMVSVIKSDLDSHKSCAIIVRTGNEISVIENFLQKNNVSYAQNYKKTDPIKRDIVEDLTAYMSFASGNHMRKVFLHIMNKPFRYINRDILPEIIDLDALISHYNDNYVFTEILLKLRRDFHKLALLSPFLAINYIAKGIGYEQYLKTKYQNNSAKKGKSLQVLKNIQTSAKEFHTQDEWISYMQDTKNESQNSIKESLNTGVQIMTMHASKGLEFDTVCIPNCNVGIIPHKKAKKEEEIEEERRMFYVGMTRAKEKLLLQYVTGDKENPTSPSPFLTLINISE